MLTPEQKESLRNILSKNCSLKKKGNIVRKFLYRCKLINSN